MGEIEEKRCGAGVEVDLRDRVGLEAEGVSMSSTNSSSSSEPVDDDDVEDSLPSSTSEVEAGAGK